MRRLTHDQAHDRSAVAFERVRSRYVAAAVQVAARSELRAADEAAADR